MSDSVIYTVILGGYDDLKEPVMYSRDFSYVCFTDDPNLKSDIWDIRLIEPEIYGNNFKSAKFFKICTHRFFPEFDYSMYIDATMLLEGIPDIPNILDGYNIAIEIHPCRDCIYEEAIECKRLNKVEPDIVDEQIEAYKADGFPVHAGLYANWMLFRKHNDSRLVELSEAWWAHVVRYSKRDQISFPFVFEGYPIKKLSSKSRTHFVSMSWHLDGT